MLILLSLLACTTDSDEANTPNGPGSGGGGNGGSGEETIPDGPGTEEWGDVDVTCTQDNDCLSNEACIDSVCQVERCEGSLEETVAPIGDSLVFAVDAEIAVSDTTRYEGTIWADAYTEDGDYSTSWDTEGTAQIKDIAGGNLMPDAETGGLVAALSGERTVQLLGTDTTAFADFIPVAIATGDTDGDGLDEAVAVSRSGELAICSMDEGTCDNQSTDARDVVDIAVGDIDGDTLAEVILLHGDRELVALNLDADWTGQLAGSWSASDIDDYLVAIETADTDGDRVAEVIGLWDGGCLDWCDDIVTRYEISGDALEPVENIIVEDQEECIDLAAADTDADGTDEIVVLIEDPAVVTIDDSRQRYRSLSISATPDHIAMVDIDGDSPRAVLERGPTPVVGDAVPLMLMLLPPYAAAHSTEGSWAGFGDESSTSTSQSETVSLGLHVDVGVGADLWGAFGANMSSTVSWALDRTSTETTTLMQGGSYQITADTDLYGPQYGGMVLSWGCFDAYTYRIEDPDGHLGGMDGEAMVMTVPTGGGTSVWSTPRYNAMAEALGGLPVVDIPYTVGDVDSYPGRAESIDGERLSESDLVFPDPRTFTASDVGSVSWVSSVAESETNAETLSTSIGVSASVTAGGVTVGGGGSYGWGEGYSLTVGESSIFSGGVPPLIDDPATNADEYAHNAYKVTPWVYRHTASDHTFYVMTYSVTD